MEISFERPSEVTSTPGRIGQNGHDGVVGVEGQCCGALVPHPQNTLVPITGQPVMGNDVFSDDSFPAFNQVILPRLNLVQASGLLKDSFPFGGIVFNQSTLLFALPTAANVHTGQPALPGTPPITITVLHAQPVRFAEQVKWPEKGRICDSEAEITALGGTLSYNEHIAKPEMPYFEFMVDTVVAIEKPEHLSDDNTIFNYPVDGKKYTIGLWNHKATAFVAAAKRVLFYARRMGVCRKGYATHSFSASTCIKKGTKNSYILPVLVPHKQSTPEFLEFARSILRPT